MDVNKTGEFIAMLRKQKGYTQKELAQKLMVSDKAVSRWETGKGFPDTSLLKPLSDLLDVSVGELLSGEKMNTDELKERTDHIILESLAYSKKMLKNIIAWIMLVMGAGLLASPLLLTAGGNFWILGTTFVLVGIVMLCWSRRLYIGALIFQITALVLEVLPGGVALVFASSPNEMIRETYSYFSLQPFGYANMTPLLTGGLTVVIVLLELIAVLRKQMDYRLKNGIFICSIVAFLFSLLPLFLFGSHFMTVTSYMVSGCMLGSILLQAVANRKFICNESTV